MGAVGITNPDGSFLSILSFPTPPVSNPDSLTNYGSLNDASWSPDGKYVAVQVSSAYRELPSSINIYDTESTKLIKQVSVEKSMYGGGCWTSTPKGEIIASVIDDYTNAGTHRVIHIYNLKTEEKKIIDISESGVINYITCS